MKNNSNIVVTNVTTPSNSQRKDGFWLITPEVVKAWGPRFFPVTPSTGRPAVPWINPAPTPELIEQWREEYSNYAIGMIMGEGLIGPDCDTDDRDAGIAAWNKFVDVLDEKGLLLSRTRVSAPGRWASLLRVSDDVKGRRVEFTGHGKEESRLLEYRGEKQMLVIGGSHKSGDLIEWESDFSPWECTPDDLPVLTPDEVQLLTDDMSAAIAGCKDWQIVNSSRTQLSHNGADASSDTIDFPPVFDRSNYTDQNLNNMVSFIMSPTEDGGLGYCTASRDPSNSDTIDFQKAMWSCMGLLDHLDDGGKAFIKQQCRVDLYDDGEQHFESQWNYEKDKSIKGPQTSFRLALKLVNDNKSAFTKFERLINNRRARSKLTEYQRELEAIGTCDSCYEFAEQIVEFEIERPSLTPRYHRLLEESFKNRFNKFAKAEGRPVVGIADVRHLLTPEATDKLDATANVNLDRKVLNKILFDLKPIKNQHGEYYLELNDQCDKSTRVAIDSTAFRQLCNRYASELNPTLLIDESFIKRVAMSLEAALSTIKDIPEFEMIKGNYQRGTVRDDDIELYRDLGDDQGNIVKLTKEGWSIVSNVDGFIFDRGKDTVAFDPSRVHSSKSLNERLGTFWDHILIPEVMRIVYLGQLVNNFFASNEQPIGVFYSPPPGGDGKSPTLHRTKQLLDPTSYLITAAPSDTTALIRHLAQSRVSIIDDVNRKSLKPGWQKKMDSYVMGGSETLKKLYDSTGTVTMDMRGPTFLTTNDELLFHSSTTRSRSLWYEFKPISDDKRSGKNEAEFDSEFAQDLDQMRSTLLDLVVAVIKTLPQIADDRGHRCKGFAQIVNAIHQILGSEGSLVETLERERTKNLTENAANDLLIQDLGHLVTMGGYTVSEPAGSLYKQISALHAHNPNARKDRTLDSTYPSSSRALSRRMKDPEFIEMAESAFLFIRSSDCKLLKQRILHVEPTKIGSAMSLYRPNQHREIMDAFEELDCGMEV